MIEEKKKDDRTPVEGILKGKEAEAVSKEYKTMVWKEKLYAPELNEGWVKFKHSLQKAQRELEERFGENFKAITLNGSWAKGFARTKGSMEERSDIDMITYLGKATPEEKKEVEKILIRNLGKYGLICNDVVELDDVVKTLREVRVTKEYDKKLEDAVVDITGLFAGIPFSSGDNLLRAQKEAFKAIAENKDGRLIWEQVSSLYDKVAVALVDDGFTLLNMYRNGVTPNYCAEIVKNSVGMTMDEFSKLLEIRKKSMSLSAFDEMRKKLAA